MRVTLRDVAEASGVSVMAVSKVLHGTSRSVRVSEQTSERILRIAKQLEYRPNSVARSLRSRKTNMVAMVFQHVYQLGEDNPYLFFLLNGVMSALTARNYTLSLFPDLGKQIGPEILDDGRFDGVLWVRPDHTSEKVNPLSTLRIPLVALHSPPGLLPDVPTFCVDNERGLELVVQHLAGLGHTKISFVVDPVNSHTTEGLDRGACFLAAAKAAGVIADIWVWDEKVESFAQHFSSQSHETALAAFSDVLAGRILVACQELEIRVPKDLSVVGFDSSSFCDRTNPPLTSLHQQVEKMAFDATTHLLEIIHSDITDRQRRERLSNIYDCTLNVRASTGNPSSRKILS